MPENKLMEQFANIVTTGDVHELQTFVNSNKAELRTLMSQQHVEWSKIPNSQQAQTAWANFNRGSGSATDLSNLQRFIKSYAQSSHSSRHDAGNKQHDNAHKGKESKNAGWSKNPGAQINAAPSNKQTKDENCCREDTCKHKSNGKNHKNKKEAA